MNQTSAVARKGGVGGSAFTTFGKVFFEKSVGDWTGRNFHNLTTVQAQILTALHELAHATGCHEIVHPKGEARAVNDKIYEACIK